MVAYSFHFSLENTPNSYNHANSLHDEMHHEWPMKADLILQYSFLEYKWTNNQVPSLLLKILGTISLKITFK